MAIRPTRRHARTIRPLSAALCGLASCSALEAVPAVLDPSLSVQTVASGLSQPTAMAFLGNNDFFVLEKATGQVKRVTNGVATTVLDLAVNSGSQRGLLGIALSPNFAADNAVNLFWTESTTGADTNALANTALLGNRVDRFIWNGSTLAFDQNLIRLRALQPDAGESEQGGNNGGVLRYGPDGKLYVMVGDAGRRGQLQNLANGPTGVPGSTDDQFGGPAPDNAHFTGAILRLNPDGSAPADNPFFAAGAAIGGQVGANIQKLYSYGHRNGFGLDFDPVSGGLWMVDNGDDAFDEINRVTPGTNAGWVQAMGPMSRIGEFKDIEVNEFAGALGEVRYPPGNIADNQADALGRLFMLPGATYSDPEFSWKYGIAPSALTFLDSAALGAAYEGNLFIGAGTTSLDDGYLLRFVLDPTRENMLVADLALADLVADNATKFDAGESASLRFGTGFGITSDIRTGPDGHLYVVSLSNGQVYRIIPSSAGGGAIPEPATAAVLLPALTLLARRRREA